MRSPRGESESEAENDEAPRDEDDEEDEQASQNEPAMSIADGILGALGGGIVGRWEFAEGEVGDTMVSREDYIESALDGTIAAYEFSANGDVTAFGVSDELIDEGTYEMDGSNAHVTFDGSTLTFTLEGGRLYLGEQGELLLVFERS